MARKTMLAGMALCALLAACGGGGDGAGIGGNDGGTSGTSGAKDGNGGNGGANNGDNTIAPATLVTTAEPAKYDDPDFANALDFLNDQRLACGFGAVRQNEALDNSAYAHADYLSFNVGERNLTPADMNDTESQDLPAFTGQTPLDRAARQGYPASSVRELVGKWHSIYLGVRYAMATAYGPQLLLSGYRDIGLGGMMMLDGSSPEAMVLDFGIPANQSPQLLGGRDVATLPCDGQKGLFSMYTPFGPVPVAGREMATNPLGRPVVAMVRAGQTLAVTSFTLTLHGHAVPATLLTAASDPNKLIKPNFVALIPDQPLQPQATYTARLVGTNNGAPVDKSWSFTTGDR